MLATETNTTREISVDNVVDHALNNTTSREAASWIIQTRKELLATGRYPSRQEMASWGLTEGQWGVLSGVIYTFPGGGANHRVAQAALLTQTNEINRHGLTPKAARKAEYVLMIHGSEIPDGPMGEQELIREMSDPRVSPGYWISSARALRSETNCGVSQGHHPHSRRGLRELVRHVTRFYGVPREQIHTLEMLAGRRNRALPINSLDAFDVHSFAQIRLHELSDRELTSDDVVVHDKEPLSNPDSINDYLRELMDEGKMIIGIGCVDARQGLILPLPEIEKICPECVGERLEAARKGLSILQGAPISSWQLVGHTEFPLAVALMGQDEKAIALAYFLMTESAVLVRNRGQLISPSYPLVMSLPEEIVYRNEGPLLAKQLTGLISNLRASYRGSAGYLTIGGQLRRLACPDAPVIAHTNGKTNSEYFDNIKTGIPLIPMGDTFNPNPPFVGFWPGSIRGIGPVIK